MKPKVLIMSSVSSTLWVFYRGLIERLASDGYEVTIAAMDDYHLNRFGTDYGCRILPMQIHRRISPLQDIRCIIKLAQLLKKEKYDLIHAHTPKAGMIGMIAAWLMRVPVRIYTLHGLPLETVRGVKKRIYRAVERLTAACATYRLAVSHSLADRAVELGVCRKDTYHILADGSACGVDPSRFCSANKDPLKTAALKNSLSIPQDAVVVGFVGRITKDKGMDCLLDAFSLLSDQYEKVYLLLVGDYDAARDNRSDGYRKKIEANPKIRHQSFVDDIVPYYFLMDLLVLPSRREGFNYALLEAGACGLPAVTTRVTGCVDAVLENETGFIVSVDDPDQLRRAMETLINNPELRVRMGSTAEQRVSRDFNSKRLIDEHVKLYRQLLDQAAGNTA
jgi:glycosyltransferase involved in cell wall biosynthesis